MTTPSTTTYGSGQTLTTPITSYNPHDRPAVLSAAIQYNSSAPYAYPTSTVTTIKHDPQNEATLRRTVNSAGFVEYHQPKVMTTKDTHQHVQQALAATVKPQEEEEKVQEDLEATTKKLTSTHNTLGGITPTASALAPLHLAYQTTNQLYGAVAPALSAQQQPRHQPLQHTFSSSSGFIGPSKNHAAKMNCSMRSK